MLKQITFLASLCLAKLGIAQTPMISILNFNDVSARISANGIFFKDQQNGLAAYRVPSLGNQTNSIYQFSFNAIALDQNQQIRLSRTNYDTTDFTAGPIATNYQDANYQQTYFNKLWSIYKIEIDNHIQQWNQVGYTIPMSIQSWPGNGDVANGMSANLAPYFDYNNNGLYDPQNGDYPIISGDYAVYGILNDQNNSSSPSTAPLNIEVHYMFYCFATADANNKTTYLNLKIYNRGNDDLTGFKWNLFTDFDLGNYADDWYGTDVQRNMIYTFNGDNMDEVFSGFPGFGANPPAIGIVSLNHNLYASKTIEAPAFPISVNDYNNTINGKNLDGTDMTFNSIPTKFQYTDTNANGNNCLALSKPAYDVRSWSSIDLGNLATNSVKCVDYAVIYARASANITAFTPVDSLMKVADFIQEFYDNNLACSDGTLGMEQNASVQFELFPNPVRANMSIQSNEFIESLIIFSLDGKIVKSLPVLSKHIDLELNNLNSGMYLIQLQTANGKVEKRFVKE